MTQDNILKALRKELDEAKRRAKEQERLEDFVEFARAYRISRGGRYGDTWDDRFPGVIFYKDNGEPNHSRVGWLEASKLAERKRDGTITDIRIRPAAKGNIAGSIYRALRKALYDKSVSPDDKRLFAKEAISGMYLLGLKDNRTLLHMIENGLEDRKNYDVVGEIGNQFRKFGMIDEYHNDLSLKDPRVIRSVIRNKLRPEKFMTDDEAFKRGFDEVYEGATGVWGDGLYAARVECVQRGEPKSGRVGWLEASKLASKMQSGEVTDVELEPKEQGKLYAAVERSIDSLINNPRAQSQFAETLFLREAIAGLYIMGRLNVQEIGTFSYLLRGRPDLGEIIEKELSKYVQS